ncbi:hypothetical protein [Dyella amyloliquefaciens]|uniref:hypothetical protein n=1 Tax=Dyella amyloliquefaciens TaxID=1770545 RepID=UPI00102E8CCF|nr:hypothetical protein [Dyella amyloliquefaciens]
MSPNVLGTAAVSLLALAGAMPVSATAQDADGIGTVASYLPYANALGSSRTPQVTTATFGPASLTGTSSFTQANLVAMGVADGHMFPNTGFLQVSSRTFGRWTVASAIAVPDVTPAPASVSAPTAWDTPHWTDTDDPRVVDFTPFAASYRISATDRIAVSLQMSMSTQPSRVARLITASANIWTLTPKVAYTKIVPSSDAGGSTVVAVGSFSRSDTDGYQNVAVGRIEALVMHRNASGWGYGGVAALIQQPYVDFSPAAGSLPGTSMSAGTAMGVGPQLSWSSRWLGSGLELQARWIYEFRSPNGHPDQPMLVSATLHL